MLSHGIYDYAKEHHILMKNGETYGTIYERIIESNPKLHTLDELKEYAGDLLDKLLAEFGFNATRVFAYYPLISTKAYHGFDEVLLFEHIHGAMGCTAQAFCKLNRITEALDKKVLQHEFKNIYRERFGFFVYNRYGGATELIHLIQLVRKHGFNKDYLTLLEEDIKDALKKVGDNYFHKMDLTSKDNILFLYDVCGIFYGFDEYRIDIFRNYDGYGHVVSNINNDIIFNDIKYLEALVR